MRSKHQAGVSRPHRIGYEGRQRAFRMRSALISISAMIALLLLGGRGFVRAGDLGISPGRVEGKSARQLPLRPDDARPEDPLTIPLFGRSLTIGGEYNLKLGHRGDFALQESVDDDSFGAVQEFELEFLYPLRENVAIFVEVKPFYTSLLSAEDGDRGVEKGVRRGESWIYFDRILGSRFAVQVGRQNFDEKREWWWDEDLDALRIYYNADSWRLEVSVAEELAQTSTDDDGIDPEQEGVLRLLGRATWDWAEKQRAELFFLYQHDHSGTKSEGAVVAADRRDESDANLAWIGARALGRWKFRSMGRLHYWLDTALVSGHEKLIDFDRLDGKQRVVDSVERRSVFGWAVDAGVTWQTRLPGRPSLTLGYALGSGDGDPHDGRDRSFRQTGLQDNNDRFRGVDSFRYYGELFRPELSNLHILTASVGFPILKHSSVELS